MSQQLDMQGQALLEQYRECLPQLKELEQVVSAMISQALGQQHLEVAAIEHRIKTEESFIGKLERKGDKYHDISDITDLLGFRIITFYSDDVDKVAAIVKQLLEVDWSNSVDKRKLHQLTSFGYNSLHYICRLKEGSFPFEVQMRTALQHAWSAIEHDLGYKGNVKLLPDFRRQFSRLAGMLELIDNEFNRLRSDITDYRRQVQSLVGLGRLDEVFLTVDSYKSYLSLHPFDRINQRIAAVNQAELVPALVTNYLSVLEHFGLETLGDLQKFIDDNSDDAYQLALSQLAITDLDILSESVGLQNLCYVHVLKNGGGRMGLKYVLDSVNGPHPGNAILADSIYETARHLPFMAINT